MSGARALAKCLEGMKSLVYVLVRPADLGGDEGRAIVEEAAVCIPSHPSP